MQIQAASSKIGAPAASHPVGLYVLFFTELWERFSYYGVRALLILYLTGPLGRGDTAALLMYGAYTSIIYFTGLAGGAVADRIIGAQRAIILGSALIILGHGCLVLSVVLGDTNAAPSLSVLAQQSEQLFLFSLSLIAIGVGLLKPNSTSAVGSLYARADVRRDSGFTLFYVGINIGAMLGPIACGFIGEVYGWAFGFGAAGAGMMVGLTIFLIFRHQVCPAAAEPGTAASPGAAQSVAVLLGIVCVAACICFALAHQVIVGYLLAAAAAGLVVYFIRYLKLHCSSQERGLLSLALIHVVFSVVFWMLLEQGGGSLNLFNARYVDRNAFGFVVPASVFMALEPIFVLLLGPVFSFAWMSLARRGRQMFVATKFALGMLLMAAGFFVLTQAARDAGDSGSIPLVIVLLVNCLFAAAECFLAPAGLSIVTGCSPSRIAGFMAGIWFLGMASGGYLAGLVASATSAGVPAGSQPPIESYATLYAALGVVGLIAAAVILLLKPRLKKWVQA